MSDQPTVPAAGWYPDPTAATPGTLRWWNGAGWSTEVRAAKPAAPITPAAPAAPTPPASPYAGYPGSASTPGAIAASYTPPAAPSAQSAPAQAPALPPYAAPYTGAPVGGAPIAQQSAYGTPVPPRAPQAGYAAPGQPTLPSYPGQPGIPAQGYEAGPYAGYGSYAGSAPLVGPGEPKSFTAAISSALKQYAGFGGRASRSEFWYWNLFTALAGIALWTVVLIIVIAGAAAARGSSDSAAFAGFSAFMGIFYMLWIALSLAVMLPGLAVSVRRLRDAGLHWAWIFISFVPGGSIALIVLWCQPAKPWALPRS